MTNIKRFIKKPLSWCLSKMAVRKVIVNLNISSQDHLLEGRTALITGGTSGIGLAIAKAYHNSGCDVVIAGRNKERLQEACASINKENSNHKASYIVMDMTNTDMLKQAFENAEKNTVHGFDILVNNAGFMGGRSNDEQEFDQVIGTNVKGVYFLSNIFSDTLIRKHEQGNILNILSSSSFRPATNPYAISKWGMRGFTIGMARKLIKHNIVVNAIAPGPTATPMLKKEGAKNLIKNNSPIGRYILPEEIANIALILVSDMCRSAVGEIFCMTGGSGNVTNEDIKF